MSAALTKLVDALFGALDLFRFWVVLYEYERGLILRFGRFHRELGPGIHWRAPLRIEELRFVNVRRQTSSAWEQTLTSMDGVTFTLSFDYMIEVSDVRSALLRVDDWARVAYNTTKMELARAVAYAQADEVLDTTFSGEVEKDVREALAEHGIALVAFALTDRCRSRVYRLFNGSRN